ncbi:MAG TPA: ABC transporter ATP-binding protein [Actinomycetales bacterium]|nr:ABC transporter ATP-binding protein [Actinomycetales bacterium]
MEPSKFSEGLRAAKGSAAAADRAAGRPSPAIDVRGLHVRRGQHEVFAGLTCQLRAGQITGILGPSGSGKTTLLRALVGVQKFQGGSIKVLGHQAGSPQLRRRVAYMTQSVSIYRDLSVEQNVKYFGALFNTPGVEIDRVISEVGLEKYRKQLARALSGGQMSRVSLAAALVGKPEVLILDEPTVGQDPVLREELWENFRSRAAAGATVLVSSHVMDEAAKCDDLLLLRQGEIIAQDSPNTLLERTGADDFEEAFLRLIRQTGAG